MTVYDEMELNLYFVQASFYQIQIQDVEMTSKLLIILSDVIKS